ncbi:MAG TPA: DUF6744 family protein [Thermaerobacter sp.]
MATVTEQIRRHLGLEEADVQFAAATKATGPGGLPMLGHLVWYSLAECRLGADVLNQLYTDHGLPSKHAPRRIRARDAFRRATTGLYHKVPREQGEVRYMIRDVATTPKEIARGLVAEIVDKEGRRLAYYHTGTVVYQDETDAIYWMPGDDSVPGELEATALKLVDLIRQAFTTARGHYTSSHIRRIVRLVLDELYPVAVRPSGGVYFVPTGGEDTLRRLQAFLHAVGTTAGVHAEFRLVPLLDTAEQREMVRASAVQEVTAQVEAMLHQMEVVLKERAGQELRQSDIQAVAGRWQYIRDLAKQYRDLLEDQLAELDGKLDYARLQVEAFLERAAG